MRTLIVDDEAAARSRLKKLLTPFEHITIVGEADNGLDGVQTIVDLSPDLVMLDVQMPGLNGFEVLRSLPPDFTWPLVIFATAFDQHALAAFDAHAVGYLLKPINRERLQLTLERATRLLDQPRQLVGERSRVQAVSKARAAVLTQVIGRLRDRYLLLPLDEVCFFRVEDQLTKVKTVSGFYRTDYRLADLETRLPNPPFFRAHRNAIVNVRMVREIAPLFKGSYLLIMKDREQTSIQVSERQSKAVRDLLHG